MILWLLPVNSYFLTLLSALHNDEPGAVGLPIPEGDYLIRIADDFQIPPQWCAATISLIVRQEFGQLQSFPLSMLSGTGVNPLCPARYDLSHTLGQILFQILNRQTP